MSRRAAMAVFLMLAVGHLWPLSLAPWRLALHGNADTMFNEWLVSWIAHVLPRDPTHLFDANIFAPERATLTYSDPTIVPGLIAAPVRWLGGSPVLAFNLATIVGLALTAFATWLLARDWTGDSRAALVAGALGAFNVHILTRLPHLAATFLWPVPAALYLADKAVERPNARHAIALAALIALTAATSLYTLALVLITLATVGTVHLIFGWSRRGANQPAPFRAGIVVSGAVVVGLVLALPVLLPYARFAASGHTRPLEMVRQLSATPAGYLASTSAIDRRWTSGFYTDDVTALFAGVVALLLAAVGLTMWRDPNDAGPTTGTQQRRRWTLIALALIGIVLSLGPATPIYRALYEWFPPMRGLRVAARFGYLYLIAVAVLAAMGARWIAVRLSGTRSPAIVVGAMVILVTAEAWQGPQPALAFSGVSRLYSLVASAPAPVLLVEVPFYPAEAIHENAEYVLASTAHWQPLANGYSGFTPDSYRSRVESFWFFPEDWAIESIRRAGTTHLMVHLERFGTERPAVEQALASRRDLTLIGSDALGHRLYVVVR